MLCCPPWPQRRSSTGSRRRLGLIMHRMRDGLVYYLNPPQTGIIQRPALAMVDKMAELDGFDKTGDELHCG